MILRGSYASRYLINECDRINNSSMSISESINKRSMSGDNTAIKEYIKSLIPGTEDDNLNFLISSE